MSESSAPRATTQRRTGLKPGDLVEVRTAFDGSWTAGFEVVEVDDESYVLCRTSDHSLLPTAIDCDAVRRLRKRETWWI
jgi:hypothetical protein